MLADNIALLAALLMTTSAQVPTIVPRPIRNLRWWIGALLFASTVINYLDRQTLSLLAPFLELEYRWNNTDYAFADGIPRSYSFGETVFARIMDNVGTPHLTSLNEPKPRRKGKRDRWRPHGSAER